MDHEQSQMISSADYIVPVEIESQTHNVYVIKRPGVDNFLKQMGEIYEVVVFTASLSKVSGIASIFRWGLRLRLCVVAVCGSCFGHFGYP